MNKNTLVIGTLTLTAIIMAVVLFSAPAHEAQAMSLASAGDFTMVTGGVQLGDEALFIIDNRSQKAILYRINNDRVEIVGAMTPTDFKKGFSVPK